MERQIAGVGVRGTDSMGCDAVNCTVGGNGIDSVGCDAVNCTQFQLAELPSHAAFLLILGYLLLLWL